MEDDSGNWMVMTKHKGACWVQVNAAGKITDTASLWKRFKGQKFSRLLTWLEHYKAVRLVEEDGDGPMDYGRID